MTNSSFDFDLIVIGAGYGGFDAAKHAAGKGLKVAIVESSDCLLYTSPSPRDGHQSRMPSSA